MTLQETILQEAIVDDAHEMISSRRVEGTPVYNPEGERLGSIHSVMIDKRSGRVTYAVMAFGGFLGVGEQVHPIPWELLSYDVDNDGYCVELSRERIKNAPSMHLDEADRPRDRAYDESVSQYYGTLNWWGL